MNEIIKLMHWKWTAHTCYVCWKINAVMFRIASLITDFFLSQQISQVILLICWNEGTHNIIKELAESSIRASVPCWMNNSSIISIERGIHSGRIGIVFDDICDPLNQILHWRDMVNGNWSHIHDVQWLILSNQHFNPGIMKINHNMASVTVASVYCYSSHSVALLYYINSAPQTEHLAGYWSSENRLELYDKSKWYKEKKLQGTSITTNFLFSTTSLHNRYIHDYNILLLLAEVLQFRLQEIHSRGLYSKPSELQMVQQLVDGCADISPGSILVTHDMIGLADFTYAIGDFRPYLYYKVQSVLSARNIYILPFSTNIWITLGSLLLAITACLTFILRRESHLSLSLEEMQPKWEFGEVLLVTVGAISQQGSARNPTTSAARTLFITLFVLAVLMFTAYSASVISLLSSPSSVISTLQGILHHSSSMDLALLNSQYYHTHFQKEKNLVSSKLHELEESPAYLDLSSGMESTLKGEVAFCADKEEAHTYLHQSKQTKEALCNVGEISLLQGPSYHRSFALRSGSSYTHIFNLGIIKLKEFGLLQREQQYWFNVEPLCDSPETPPGSQFVTITLSNIYPPLHLLCMGIFCAIILLAVEIVIHYSVRWYQIKYSPSKINFGSQLQSIRGKQRMSRSFPLPFVH